MLRLHFVDIVYVAIVYRICFYDCVCNFSMISPRCHTFYQPQFAKEHHSGLDIIKAETPHCSPSVSTREIMISSAFLLWCYDIKSSTNQVVVIPITFAVRQIRGNVATLLKSFILVVTTKIKKQY
jgi:hypothetical protein